MSAWSGSKLFAKVIRLSADDITVVGKALDFGMQADLWLFCWFSNALRLSRGGGQGVVPPPHTHTLKNHKNIGFLSNTGPDPLKNHKATKPAFNVGP